MNRSNIMINQKMFFLLTVLLLCVGCRKTPVIESLLVDNNEELKSAIDEAQPGDVIVLANGVWKDVEIEFKGQGTKDNPILLRAETEGKVFIEGVSNLAFGGEYLIVSGLHFRNGYSPSENVIAFRINKNNIANNCRVTNCVIVDFKDRKSVV